MKVRARLFAQLREIAGEDEVELSLERPTAAAAFEALVNDHPAFGRYRDVVRFAVDNEYVQGDVVLSEGSEVIFIPPVSGG